MIVVAFDWGLGHVVEGWRSDDAPRSDARQGEARAGEIERDPRPDAPALADAPWASDLFDELNALEYDYVPFVVSRAVDRAGPLITMRDGVRQSHQPRVQSGDEPVEIWFFGGSTMFGEGQRDAHTIPSEVARLAERDRLAVRVRNYGQQGYTAWQELLVFEQEVASRSAPDVVVFYDGTNEFNAQIEDPRGQPSQLDREGTARGLSSRGLPLPDQLTVPTASVFERYREASLLHKAWRRASELFGTPAEASGGFPPDLERNVREAYLRTVDLVETLAADHDVTPVFIWQPVGAPSDNPYNVVARSLPDPVVDLSEVLTGLDEDVFIDGSHTNERGARIVAEEIYRVLEPLITDAGRP